MVDESATYQESTNLHLNRDFRLTVEHDEHLSLREKLNNNINAIKVLRNLQSSSNLSIYLNSRKFFLNIQAGVDCHMFSMKMI